MGPDLDETLEIFGQQSVGVTTPFVFCYSLPDTVDFPAIISTLESGLRRLTDGFPWVAGKVINQGKTEVNSGVFKIKHGWDTPRLFVKDHRDNVRAPTMQSLSEARFPVSMLPESIFSPINVLPTDPDQDRSPVFVVQINRIEGGLLLAIIGNHQALDGTGQEQLSYLLNKACNGLPFSEDELRIGNLSRSTIVMPLDDSWQPSPNSRYLKIQQKVATVDELPPTNPRWVTISFSGEALSMLKAKANNEIQSGFHPRTTP